MATIKVVTERRVPAPHPGPIVKSDFFDPVGLTAGAFARGAGLDATAVEEMLAGTRSIDVGTAIALARTLHLPAERIMQMQLKADFAVMRATRAAVAADGLNHVAPIDFPPDHMRGRLGRAGDEAAGDGSVYFQQDLERRVEGDVYAGLHALWRGDRLRIYAPHADRILWVGPILQNLDGHVMLPFVRPIEWREWFAQGHRADMAFGDDHRTFFERMGA